MIEKAKQIVVTALTFVVIVMFILGGWLVTAWLYPDEWFAEIPKLILDLLGFEMG